MEESPVVALSREMTRKLVRAKVRDVPWEEERFVGKLQGLRERIT